MPDRKSYIHGFLTATFIAAAGSGFHSLALDPSGAASGPPQFTVTAMLGIGYACAAVFVHVGERRRWTRAPQSN